MARTCSRPVMTFGDLGNISRDEFFILVTRHAHRPLKEASANLGVGTTWLKGFLRGMHPPYLWAYRQIASIDTALLQSVAEIDKRTLWDSRRKFILSGKKAVDCDGVLCVEKIKPLITKHRKRRHYVRKAEDVAATMPPKRHDVKEIFGFSV